MLDFVQKGRISEIIELGNKTKRFLVQSLDGAVYDFVPGQFVVVSFPNIPHHFPYRSFSIANEPGLDILEFCIVLKEDGAATPVLFQMKTGEVLNFTKPLGGFTVPDGFLEEELCFVCTGTGVAPFRSMIRDWQRKGIHPKKLHLIFGTRTQEGLLYREEWEALARNTDWFSFYPVLSREQWDGRKGYVHQVYQELFKDKRPAMFYLCGWNNMVKEAKNNLKDMGYTRKEIKLELYD